MSDVTGSPTSASAGTVPTLPGHRLSPWWWTVASAPLVAVATRALADQHSDNIVPAVYSAEHPFDLYLPRIVPLIQFLAFPIDDYSANLRFQVLLRVFAFCVVIVWISRRVADFLGGSRAVAVGAATLLAAYFFVRYPEAGDSIYYGVSAGMTSTAVFLLSLAAGHRVERAASSAGRIAWATVSLALAIAASFYYVTLLLWAWLLLVLDVASRDHGPSRNGRATLIRFARKARVQTIVLVLAGMAAVVYLRTGSGENTGLSIGRSLRVVLRTRYLWDQWNFYILENLLIIVGLAALTLLVGRSMRSLVVGVLAAAAGAGVFAIAALDHVADNVHLPRYYAPSLFIGLTIGVSAAAVTIARRQRRVPHDEDDRRGVLMAGGDAQRRLSTSRAAALAVIVSLVGFTVFVRTPIGFGYEGSDGQQIRKQGFPLPPGDIRTIEAEMDIDLTFVTGAHWQAWVTAFTAHENGERLFPVAPFTRAFARSDRFIPVVPTYGVCLDLSDGQCVEVAQSLVPANARWQFSVLSSATGSGGRTLHIMKLDRT